MHDALALLVPASSAAARIADLAGKKVCVEPGTPADRALVRAFARRGIALREHPFQESDEMRQAYGTGNCDALAGPLTTLANVRSDPNEGRPADRILPELLADDPIFAATGGDARWSRIVWWTFSVLVDAEEAGISGGDAARAAAIPGVPPLAGRQLGLAPGWARDALAAGGNYGEIFERDLGAASRLKLTRGDDALWSSGGSIFGLHVE
jgi:general L-amino acid transport system substrate-binding protein